MNAPIASHWLAAARAEFAQPSDWQRWADNIIVAQAEPPLWIINMSMATDIGKLRKALAEQLDFERNEIVDMSDDELQIGYLWLRHQNRAIGLGEVLRLIGERVDSGISRMQCEIIYELLNRLEKGESSEKIESQANDILKPLSGKIKGQWDDIRKMAAH